MRIKKRIEIIKNALKSKENKTKVLEYWFGLNNNTENNEDLEMPSSDILDILDRWENNYENLKDDWLNNPHLRLSQLLVINNIMKNYNGCWYNIEDDVLMIKSGVLEEREILFWGKNYDKKGNRLDKTRWVLLKDMGTDHIESILRDISEELYEILPLYKNEFIRELKLRNINKL